MVVLVGLLASYSGLGGSIDDAGALNFTEITYADFEPLLRAEQDAKKTFLALFSSTAGTTVVYRIIPEEPVAVIQPAPQTDRPAAGGNSTVPSPDRPTTGGRVCSCSGKISATAACKVGNISYYFEYEDVLDEKNNRKRDSYGAYLRNVIIGKQITSPASLGSQATRYLVPTEIGGSCTDNEECGPTTIIDDKGTTLAGACGTRLIEQVKDSKSGVSWGEDPIQTPRKSAVSFREACRAISGEVTIPRYSFENIIDPATKKYIDSRKYSCGLLPTSPQVR